MKVHEFRKCLDDIERIYGESGREFDVVIKTHEGTLFTIRSTVVADQIKTEWGGVVRDKGFFGLEIGDDMELPRLIT